MPHSKNPSHFLKREVEKFEKTLIGLSSESKKTKQIDYVVDGILEIKLMLKISLLLRLISIVGLPVSLFYMPQMIIASLILLLSTFVIPLLAMKAYRNVLTRWCIDEELIDSIIAERPTR